MSKSNTNTLTQIDSNKEIETIKDKDNDKDKDKDKNETKHKQFSSLEELNKFMDNLFRLLHIVKGFENIQYIIYGGVIRDILLGDSHNDIDIALFYPKNFNKEFRSDELDSRLETISDFTKIFFDFKIDIDRKKLDYSLLKINVNLPNNLYIHVDITSYNSKPFFCDFTVNNLEYYKNYGLNTIVKGKYCIDQSFKDIYSRTLRFVLDINKLKFCERTKLVERSNKMLERGFTYDKNEYKKDPFLDTSTDKKICPICQFNDDNEKMYHLCSTCNASYHLQCANKYILITNNQNIHNNQDNHDYQNNNNQNNNNNQDNEDNLNNQDNQNNQNNQFNHDYQNNFNYPDNHENQNNKFIKCPNCRH